MQLSDEENTVAVHDVLKELSDLEIRGLAQALPGELLSRKIGLNVLRVSLDSWERLFDDDMVIWDESDVLATLTPEQQNRTEFIKLALAEKFTSMEDPLTTFDFGLVAAGEGVARRVFVTLIREKGVFKGSYDAIYAQETDDDFIITVNGLAVDTRPNMNGQVYTALVVRAREMGINPLPDTINRRIRQMSTQTWMTACQPFGLSDSLVYTGRTVDGKACLEMNRKNIDTDFITGLDSYFRPTVPIE